MSEQKPVKVTSAEAPRALSTEVLCGNWREMIRVELAMLRLQGNVPDDQPHSAERQLNKGAPHAAARVKVECTGIDQARITLARPDVKEPANYLVFDFDAPAKDLTRQEFTPGHEPVGAPHAFGEDAAGEAMLSAVH